MIQLYDHYHQASRDLRASLQQAGYEGVVVVLNEDGFLPEDMTSPYAYFCQMEQGQGKALYFNQLPVPEFWEIRGTSTNAEVWDYAQLRAKIFYAEPKHYRLIKNVDWYDEGGRVKLTEHYNQYGWRFATTTFTNEQKIAIKIYYNQLGQEVIVENALTGDIILNWQGQTQFFANRKELVAHYIQLRGYSLESIVYNSLSTPFFYSYGLSTVGRDYLFWQEEIGDSLPGNMQILLNSPATRTQQVLIQNRRIYEKAISLATEEQRAKMSYLGLLYPQRKINRGSRQILIVTNSDQLEGLEELTDQLPDFDFHIAALTEMSAKLLAFDRLSNIHLYAGISEVYLTSLYEQCDIYLDINRGNEVLSAVRRAFEYNQVILGFQETRHQADFGLNQNYLPVNQVGDLVARLKGLGSDDLTSLARLQRINQATEEDYHKFLVSLS